MKKARGNSLIFLLLISSYCTSQNVEDGMGNFDISPDENQIVFAFGKEKKSSICATNLNGKNTRILVQSNGDTSYTNPRYSKDGTMLLFVKHGSKDFRKSSLCIANADGKNVKTVFNGDGIITEGIFSDDDHQIIFCKASQYSKHSPVGIKQAHGFDLFSINLLDRKITKLADFDAYGITSISEVDSDYILFRLEAGAESGIYSFDKKNSSRLKKIVPSNNPRNESFYRDPAYDRNSGSLIFTAPYELYSMNLNDRVAKLIYDLKGVSQITVVRLFKSQNKLLFKKETERNVLQILDVKSGVSKAVYIETSDL